MNLWTHGVCVNQVINLFLYSLLRVVLVTSGTAHDEKLKRMQLLGCECTFHPTFAHASHGRKQERPTFVGPATVHKLMGNAVGRWDLCGALAIPNSIGKSRAHIDDFVINWYVALWTDPLERSTAVHVTSPFISNYSFFSASSILTNQPIDLLSEGHRPSTEPEDLVGYRVVPRSNYSRESPIARVNGSLNSLSHLAGSIVTGLPDPVR